jgi:hypothetical protein
MSTTLEPTVNETPAVALIPTGQPESRESIAAFASLGNFEAAQRMAKALSSSTIVPESYRGEKGFPNCLVAMELASRTRASVMMVMQNVHVIQGKPSWSASFLIASVNSCGRFSPLRFETEGEPIKEGWRCRAVATELATGNVLEGEWITAGMVIGEGWSTKAGSKWKTMPGQMIRYRAASFWTRVYAPEISLGMRTIDEVEDIGEPRTASLKTLDLNKALEDADEYAVEVEASDELKLE